MTEIGKFNRLRVVKRVDFGVYLDGGELGEILLPRKYVPENCGPGDMLEVFICLDSEDRLLATTEKPLATAGEIALLEVAAVNAIGAFLDWGLPKNLLAPFREQKQPMTVGRRYLVYVYLDPESNRLVASSKLEKFLGRKPADFRPGREVALQIVGPEPLGYQAVIDGTHLGMLYQNEVFQHLTRGQKIAGFIKKVRDDGKIDLCLQPPGYEKVAALTERVLSVLRANDGFIGVTEKTPPENIYKMFDMSKKTYKKVIGALYREKIISITGDGIKLT